MKIGDLVRAPALTDGHRDYDWIDAIGLLIDFLKEHPADRSQSKKYCEVLISSEAYVFHADTLEVVNAK